MILASDFGLSWILEVVALVLVVAIVWRYVWSNGLRLRQRMDDRRAAIGAQLAAGEEAKRQAAELLEGKRAALAQARDEAAAITAQAARAASELEAEGDRLAEEDYARYVERAHAQIEGARARVRNDVLVRAGAIIVAAVEAVIDSELDQAAHHRLIAEAIAATEAEER